jgi:hypothetical protein
MGGGGDRFLEVVYRKSHIDLKKYPFRMGEVNFSKY